jgi:hypothetical protein
MSHSGVLRQFVIYDHPTDYPLGFVVREWLVTAQGPQPGEAWTATTLEDARTHIPDGSVNLGRTEQDDAKIAEVWMV